MVFPKNFPEVYSTLTEIAKVKQIVKGVLRREGQKNLTDTQT
jgi:hypothetical protein